jgi:hypothetical protein
LARRNRRAQTLDALGRVDGRDDDGDGDIDTFDSSALT